MTHPYFIWRWLGLLLVLEALADIAKAIRMHP